MPTSLNRTFSLKVAGKRDAPWCGPDALTSVVRPEAEIHPQKRIMYTDPLARTIPWIVTDLTWRGTTLLLGAFRHISDRQYPCLLLPLDRSLSLSFLADVSENDEQTSSRSRHQE
jgi:hypothetical protein